LAHYRFRFSFFDKKKFSFSLSKHCIILSLNVDLHSIFLFYGRRY
jgi:hypothetical protein